MVGESNETLALKARVEALPDDEIKPDLKVVLSVEMVKDAVNTKKITLEAAKQFAFSLMEDCSIPVVIGTSEKKVFPIEDIINARPFIVENLKDTARNEGVDYERAAEMRRQKAEEVIEGFMKEYGRQNQKFGPFAQYLSFKQRSDEAKLQGERLKAAKQVLQGGEVGDIKTDDESVSRFIQTEVSNVFFGKELQNWLNNR